MKTYNYSVDDLAAGDYLLYKPSSFMGHLIAIKTWHDVSHIEIYIGKGRSIAAREEGVNEYPLRMDKLIFVLRPKIPPFNLVAGMKWFNTYARGQDYDYIGLLRFTMHSSVKGVVSDDKMFCSELGTRFARNANLPVFSLLDADEIAPYQFLGEDAFSLVIPKSVSKA